MTVKTPLIDVDAATANRRRIHRLRAEENGTTKFASGSHAHKLASPVHKPRGAQR